MQFDGAKLALYFGSDLAVILRDDTPGLVWPGYWDLPGGGREGQETAAQCALRETYEELGILVPESTIIWSRGYDEGTKRKWFFVAKLPAQAAQDVRFGDEGQRWKLMSEREFLGHPKAVPMFKARLAHFLDDLDSGAVHQ